MGLPPDKITYKNGRFTTTRLSSGQRKRLALAVCILEGRDICIFDEVAADLDPEYRDTYYYDILSELKSRGTTVFVVSHDKEYWHVGDRVLQVRDGQFFEYGKAEIMKWRNDSKHHVPADF